MKTKRREATEEQKQRARERRERFAKLAKAVAEMSEEERAALVAKVGAIVTVEGRALSPLNSCLILMQCPNASLVGGLRQWREHGKRAVQKGQSGLAIWIPTGKGSTAEPTAEDVKAEGEGEKAKRTGFVMGYVWDVSQTRPIEGEDAGEDVSDEGAAEPVAPVNPLECRMCGMQSESAARCSVCGHQFAPVR